jgi:hypothetical protein
LRIVSEVSKKRKERKNMMYGTCILSPLKSTRIKLRASMISLCEFHEPECTPRANLYTADASPDRLDFDSTAAVTSSMPLSLTAAPIIEGTLDVGWEANKD